MYATKLIQIAKYIGLTFIHKEISSCLCNGDSMRTMVHIFRCGPFEYVLFRMPLTPINRVLVS